MKWSFSYNSLVKFNGEKTWEPLHDCYIQISVVLRYVIKRLHCMISSVSGPNMIEYEIKRTLKI